LKKNWPNYKKIFYDFAFFISLQKQQQQQQQKQQQQQQQQHYSMLTTLLFVDNTKRIGVK